MARRAVRPSSTCETSYNGCNRFRLLPRDALVEPAGSQSDVLERRLGRAIRRRRIAAVAEHDPDHGVGVLEELKRKPRREDEFRGIRNTDPSQP